MADQLKRGQRMQWRPGGRDMGIVRVESGPWSDPAGPRYLVQGEADGYYQLLYLSVLSLLPPQVGDLGRVDVGCLRHIREINEDYVVVELVNYNDSPERFRVVPRRRFNKEWEPVS